MQESGQLFFRQRIQQMFGHAKIIVSRDFYVQRRTGHDFHFLPQFFNQFGFIGRIGLASMRRRL